MPLRHAGTGCAADDRAAGQREADAAGSIRVQGARVHNLRNVDVQVPRDALVVFTGVSGSGKSSLAFGTLFAEAQRRFFDSVSPYARRFIAQAEVPDVDSIDGLPPAIALQQQRGATNIRSSIGSLTTISNLLRMLYSRAGDYPARQAMLYAEDFSPNTPQGACPTCHGLGQVYDVTEASMVPDDSLTIRERAVASWPPAWHGQNLRDILVTLGIDVDKPWKQLPKKTRDWILYTEERPTAPVYAGFTPAETRAALRAKTEPSYQGTFIGARQYVLQTFASTQSALMRKRVARFMSGMACASCGGKRLKREALSVTFRGRDIAETQSLTLDELRAMLETDDAGLPSGEGGHWSRGRSQAAIARRVAGGGAAHLGAPDVRLTDAASQEKRMAAQQIARGILDRLCVLNRLGLGYLSLDRSSPTLSPGELQRVRLATQIHSNLFGVVYVLDEPTAGLHPADGEALISSLQALKGSGNSVFVVEHDQAMIRCADWIVDVGPGAGSEGGRVLYSGPLEGLQRVSESATARHLFAPPRRQPVNEREADRWLRLGDVEVNNLRGLDVAFPLGLMTAVTGVSGSGKSSLVSLVLVQLLSRRFGEPVQESEPTEEDLRRPQASGRIVSGGEHVRRIVQVDQKPIGRTPRSNLATYTELFDHVRKLFAATPEARRKRYTSGRFSFNVEGGRCETCQGEGFVFVELLYMPSVYAPCSTCHGARFNEATLKIRYRERNIAEVLAMTVAQACEFFADEGAILRPLELLREIGVGYLRLGQPATELSGGEAQRIKLATELQRPQRGATLYVLDEPTTGLHPADVELLVAQLRRLVEAGNTVVLVEHDLNVISACDWTIDIGPGAGSAGGQVLFAGRPADLATCQRSAIAPYLRAHLAAGL